MDLVDIGESNTISTTGPYTAAAMEAPEHQNHLLAQDPALSVIDLHVGDPVADIRTGEVVCDNNKHVSSTNKVFQVPPGVSLPGGGSPDITFVSTDHASFQVHRDIIGTVSWNDFNSILHGEVRVVYIPETSSVLDLLLCAIYDIPKDAGLDAIKAVVERMEKYGLTPSHLINPTKAMFVELCAHATHHAIDVFVLAAKHDLERVAQIASSHLLSFNLQTGISSQIADEMGVLYLQRLFLLHRERLDRLKEYLTIAPVAHDPLDACPGNGAIKAWIFPATALMITGRHDISPEEITEAMVSGANGLWCSVCCGNYMHRVSTTVEMWSTVRSTI